MIIYVYMHMYMYKRVRMCICMYIYICVYMETMVHTSCNNCIIDTIITSMFDNHSL